MNNTLVEDQAWTITYDSPMVNPRPGFESAVSHLVQGLHEYSAAHFGLNGTLLADSDLGDDWFDAARAVLNLLDGEVGRLDKQAIESELRRLASENGFEVKL